MDLTERRIIVIDLHSRSVKRVSGIKSFFTLQPDQTSSLSLGAVRGVGGFTELGCQTWPRAQHIPSVPCRGSGAWTQQPGCRPCLTASPGGGETDTDIRGDAGRQVGPVRSAV